MADLGLNGNPGSARFGVQSEIHNPISEIPFESQALAAPLASSPLNKYSAIFVWGLVAIALVHDAAHQPGYYHAQFPMLAGAAVAGVLRIPSEAYNLLGRPTIKAALERLMRHRSRLVRSLETYSRHIEQTPSLAEHTSFLARLGPAAGLRGPTLYYPFGGFDPYSAFGLLPDILDVVAFGLGRFGSARDITHFFRPGQPPHVRGGL